jgi:hypothetical protein
MSIPGILRELLRSHRAWLALIVFAALAHPLGEPAAQRSLATTPASPGCPAPAPQESEETAKTAAESIATSARQSQVRVRRTQDARPAFALQRARRGRDRARALARAHGYFTRPDPALSLPLRC